MIREQFFSLFIQLVSNLMDMKLFTALPAFKADSAAHP
jgi:hypothetical protein